MVGVTLSVDVLASSWTFAKRESGRGFANLIDNQISDILARGPYACDTHRNRCSQDQRD
jgi:hypothetical protein